MRDIRQINSKNSSSTPFRSRDGIKLACMAMVLICVLGVFWITPTLTTPTLIALLNTVLLLPFVDRLERHGITRSRGIPIVFGGVCLAVTLAIFVATRSLISEWDSFKIRAPEIFWSVVSRVEQLEAQLKLKFPVLAGINPSKTLLAWGEQTGQWFLHNGPALVGDLLTWIILVPILTFVFMNDRRNIKQSLLGLIPNRYFEVTYMITTRVSSAMSDYVRAKLIEATLIGALTTGGLLIVGAPYALVLGLIAGVTNVIPYLGPLIGAAPALAIALMDPANAELLFPVLMVYVFANVLDMAFFFPIVVAKLVNLHPILLLVAVIIGQQYYGLVGMLISIPILSTVKIVLEAIHLAIYRPSRRMGAPSK